jgi:hypothetical protein
MSHIGVNTSGGTIPFGTFSTNPHPPDGALISATLAPIQIGSSSLDISENAKPADAAVRENIHPDVVEFLFGPL